MSTSEKQAFLASYVRPSIIIDSGESTGAITRTEQPLSLRGESGNTASVFLTSHLDATLELCGCKVGLKLVACHVSHHIFKQYRTNADLLIDLGAFLHRPAGTA